MDLLKPYIPHLDVLRWHVVRILVAWALAGVAVFTFHQPIMDVLVYPLFAKAPHATLLATGVTELFNVYLKLAVWGGFFVALPYTLAEVWAFISPALYPHEKKMAAMGLIISPLMSAFGALFAWFLLLPTMLGFFLGITAPGVTTMPHIADYVSFVLVTVGMMALAFNLPLVLIVLMYLGLLDVATLRRQRRVVIIGLFIMAGVITPTPDPLSQIIVAVPMCLLFEGAVFIGGRIRKA